MQRWRRRNIWGKLVKLRDRPKDLRSVSKCLSKFCLYPELCQDTFLRPRGKPPHLDWVLGAVLLETPWKFPDEHINVLLVKSLFIKIYPSIFLLAFALYFYILLIYHLLIFGLNFVKIQLLLFCFIFFQSLHTLPCLSVISVCWQLSKIRLHWRYFLASIFQRQLYIKKQ